MMSLRHLAAVLLWLSAVTLSATAPVTDTRTQAFDQAFRTIQVKVNGNDQALPVIHLDGSDRLTIEFDELAESRSYLRYELVHCNAAWQPDDLLESEYLDGFNQAEVEDYSFSRATLNHYVHYRISIPNGGLRPLISGNYLLRVYDEDDPDTILLQVRFCVTEDTMGASINATSRTDIDYNDRHQQLTVTIDTDRVPVRDPNTDLRVVVSQNGRPDSEVTLVTPVSVSGTLLTYAHLPELIFPAGNEYRRFETVSTRHLPMGVEGIKRNGTDYEFYLYADAPRAGSNYLYDQTQHGRMRVREYDSPLESDTEAEYVNVHFMLEMPEQTDGDIFIDGDMVYRMLDPSSRMVYSYADNAYHLVMRLKQGAYNYQYLFVPHGSLRGVTSRVEGDHYETSNEYVVKVYVRQPGERYDRLTGVRQLILDK